MPTPVSIRRLALSMTLAAIALSAEANDRQQASLTVDRAPMVTAHAHYDRVRPHGPLGTAGRLAALQRAMALHQKGDGDRALAAYGEALRLEPDNVTARLNRGIVLSTHKAEPRQAMADLDRVLILHSSNTDALMFRGDARMRLGNYRGALADLDLLVALAPANAQARVLRGVARALLGQTVLAGMDYAQALLLDPNNVDALVNRAAILAEGGDAAAALHDLDTAVTLDPRHALARYNRGYARFASRDHDGAIADYSAAIDIDPKLGWAYLNRCVTRLAAGQGAGRAAADCLQARRLLPNVSQVREAITHASN